MALTNKKDQKVRLTEAEAIARAKKLLENQDVFIPGEDGDTRPVGWIEGMLPPDVAIYMWQNITGWRTVGNPWRLLVKGDALHDGFMPEASFTSFEGQNVVRRSDTVLFYCSREEYDRVMTVARAGLANRLNAAHRAPGRDQKEGTGFKQVFNVDIRSGRETLVSEDGDVSPAD